MDTSSLVTFYSGVFARFLCFLFRESTSWQFLLLGCRTALCQLWASSKQVETSFGTQLFNRCFEEPLGSVRATRSLVFFFVKLRFSIFRKYFGII